MISIKSSGFEKVKNSIDEKVRKRHVACMLFLDRNLVKATPVDTGRARSNWIASISAPSRSKLNIQRLSKKQKKQGMFKAYNNKGLIGSIQPYSISYMSNNMPYIIKLNNGHSDKNRKINWIGEIVKNASKKFS